MGTGDSSLFSNSSDHKSQNSSVVLYPEKVFFPWWFIGFLWLIMVILSIETIVGNLMVLLAYRLDHQIQRHLSNRFIVSLAISDLIIGLEGFPLLTVYVASGLTWPLGHVVCQIWLCLDYTLCLVSILTVLLITVDRYCSVCYPALYIKWQSEKKTHWMIALSWIIPALFFGIMIFGWTAFTGEAVSDPTKCYAPFLNDPYVNMSMYIVYYWTTLLAMLILYRGIHKTAKSLEKRGEQREKQSLALLMGQRCMAQVGVGLLIKSQVVEAETVVDCERHTCAVTTWPADSGYGTTAQPTQNVGDANKSPSPIKKNVVKKAPLLLSQLNQSSIGSLDPYDNISLMSGFYDMSTSSVLALKFDSGCNPRNRLREKKWSSTKMTMERNGSCKGCQSSKKTPRRGGSKKKDSSSGRKETSSAKPLLQTKSTSLIGFSEEQLRAAIKANETLEPKKEKVRAKKSDESFTGRSQSCYQKPSRSQSTSSSSSDECEIVQEITRRATCRANIKLKEKEKSLQRQASNEKAPKPQKAKLLGGSLKIKKESLEVPESSPQSSKSQRDDSDTSIVPPAHQPRRNALSALFSTGWLLHRRRKKTKAEKRARKAFRTITVIVGFFALFWSPYYIVATIYGFCPSCVPTSIFVISYYMCYLNSSGNPFAYALANRQFRVAFNRLLRRDFRHV